MLFTATAIFWRQTGIQATFTGWIRFSMESGAGRTKVRRRTLAAQLDTGRGVCFRTAPGLSPMFREIFRMRINVLEGLPGNILAKSSTDPW